MAKFNWKSIDSKIKAATSSESFKKKAFASKSGEVSEMAIKAADEFLTVIDNSIKSAGFTSGQSPVVSSWSRGDPSVANDTATITVSLPNYDGMSLYDRKAEGPVPVDLAEMFIKGSTPGGYVYGEWHGAFIRSSRSLIYQDFVGDAIEQFNGRTGDGYTVTNISRS